MRVNVFQNLLQEGMNLANIMSIDRWSKTDTLMWCDEQTAPTNPLTLQENYGHQYQEEIYSKKYTSKEQTHSATSTKLLNSVYQHSFSHH